MANKITQKQQLLSACQNRLNEWVCGYCNSNSTQPARITATLRSEGYVFEETKRGYCKLIFCPHCGQKRTHYKLLSAEPINESKEVHTITPSQRKRVISILGKKDAFTNATITSSTPEIDHKEPMIRRQKDINIDELTDTQIKDTFQILTRQNNLLKDKSCKKCKSSGIRPPHMGIYYWYAGDENYKGTCVGCGWYDGVAWRENLNKRIIL